MFQIDKPRVAIIDFGMGNLFSVKQACVHAGLDAMITHQKEDILRSSGVILPGVGAFGTAMAHLHNLDLVEPLKEIIESQKPLLGICLGMQLLMSRSEEFGFHKGLNIVKGSVIRFHDKTEMGKLVKVPQVGWNKILRPQSADNNFWADTPLECIDSGEYMYFVHSYRVVPDDSEIILSVSHYGNVEFCSAFRFGNVFATQFHPEKSAQKGLVIYKNWASLVLNSKYSSKTSLIR